MAEILERCNRFEYSATHDITMSLVKTKPFEHTKVWVRVSCAPHAALATDTVIVLGIFINASGVKVDTASPTEYIVQLARLNSSTEVDDGTWFDVPFLFEGWPEEEMILNITVARLNSATNHGTPSTEPLYVRRVMVYTSL